MDELKLLLKPGDLLVSLFLIERSLGDKLSSQVLYLLRVLLLDCLGLLAHDRSPDTVQLIQDLGDAGLCHLSIEGLPDLLDLSHGLGWDPRVLKVGAMLRLLG